MSGRVGRMLLLFLSLSLAHCPQAAEIRAGVFARQPALHDGVRASSLSTGFTAGRALFQRS